MTLTDDDIVAGTVVGGETVCIDCAYATAHFGRLIQVLNPRHMEHEAQCPGCGGVWDIYLAEWLAPVNLAHMRRAIGDQT